MKLRILSPFKFAHRGCDVVAYEPGQEVDTEDADLITVSTVEGWAEPIGMNQIVAHGGAPENAAHTGAPKTKPKKA